MVRKPGKARFFTNDIRFGMKRQQYYLFFPWQKKIKELSQEHYVHEITKIHT